MIDITDLSATVSGSQTILVYVTFDGTGSVRGGPRSMLISARHFRRFRPVFVVNRKTRYDQDISQAGFDLRVLPVERLVHGLRSASWGERLNRLRLGIRHARALLAVAREQNASILHCQDVNEALTVGIAVRFTGRKVVLHVRDGASNDRRIGFLLASAIANRTIYVSEPLRDAWIDSVSPSLRDWLRRRSVAVPNGLDVSSLIEIPRNEARARLGLPEAAFVVSMVGPLESKKNQLRLLEQAGQGLLNLSRDLVIVCAGSERADPAYARRVHTLIERWGQVDRVRFLGELPHASMNALYASTDVLLIPSVVEGLPRIAIEAQAFGCPVVATAIPGNKGVLLDGHTGHLVPLDRLDLMVKCVDQLRDRGIHARAADLARSFVRERFDPRRLTDQIEAVYEELLEARNPT